MSDQHERFASWLRGPRDTEPPRDAAFHAAFCSDCRRSIAAFDALAAVDLGAAPLPPVGSATSGARVLMPLEPSMRWMLGLFAVATLALVTAIVIPGALRQSGGGLASGPNPEAEGGILGQLGTPSPRPSTDASGEPSTIRIGQKIPSTLEGTIVVPSGPAPTDGPPVIFGPTEVPFATSFPFPSFPFPPFTFAPGPTPTGQPTFPASAPPSTSAPPTSVPTAPPPTASATASSSPTSSPTANPTPQPTATPPPTPTPVVTPTPVPSPTPGPFDSASCFDGVDNDGDGAIDSQDLGCNPLLVLTIGEGFLDPIL